MQYKEDGDTYIIYVEQNEAIMKTLTSFCKEKTIDNAQLSGIGAIKDIEVGAYDLVPYPLVLAEANPGRAPRAWREDWFAYMCRPSGGRTAQVSTDPIADRSAGPLHALPLH